MYIPPNKIDPRVYYTNGGEYYYASNLTNYVGYYRKDVNGRAYAGKELTVNSPQLTPSIIVRSSPPPNINLGSSLSTTYLSISRNTKQSLIESSNPIPDSLPPTQQEYDQTFYTRYFLEYLLSSKSIIVEVNKGTYFNYVNSNLRKYFNNVELLWKISGPLYDVKENGILMKGGVIDSNLRSIDQAQKTMPGIRDYLKDLTLYYKE
jgi:hypothetical protein